MKEQSTEELVQMIDEYIKTMEEKDMKQKEPEKKDVVYKVKKLGKYPLAKS
ncbi:MAG: hypothetical protein IJ193_02120 [Bacilli bacterium]|nr:hypothetical protein [Bacilli bacterium]